MRSPKVITPQVMSFAKDLAPDGQVIEIKSRPVKGAIVNECYDTVSDYVKIHGGQRVLGWFIGEWPNAFLLGELHAVWIDDEGNYLDVSCHPIRQQRILFIPDRHATVPKIQEQNRFFALSDDPLIATYIESENEAHIASNPECEYVVVNDPKVMQAQDKLLRCKLALSKNYGWPLGAPMKIRALSKFCI